MGVNRLVETMKTENKKHSSNSNSNSKSTYPGVSPYEKEINGFETTCPALYRCWIYIYIFTEIAHWMIVVCSVQDVSIQRNTAITTSASLLPNNKVDAAIVATKKLGDVLFNAFRVNVPADLKDSMRRTIAFALDFMLDTLDCCPDGPSVPANEADLRLQPSAEPMMKDQYCVILWNDDKHSHDEVVASM